MFTLISTKDMAEKLGYNRVYLTQLANAGKIPGVRRKGARQWLFDPDAVQKFLVKQNVQKLLD